MVDHRGTLTGDEHAVLEFLLEGPALLGPRTEILTRRPVPVLYDQPSAVAAGRLADTVADPDRPAEVVRTVDAKIVRRLAERGWVLIDAGGTATIRAHRLAKPLPGGLGDGHAVVCSCGQPFESWADAEAHQLAAEAAP